MLPTSVVSSGLATMFDPPQHASLCPKPSSFPHLNSPCGEGVFLTGKKAESQGGHITCPKSQSSKESKFRQGSRGTKRKYNSKMREKRNKRHGIHNSSINLGKQWRKFPGNERPGEARPDWSKRTRNLKRGVSGNTWRNTLFYDIEVTLYVMLYFLQRV